MPGGSDFHTPDLPGRATPEEAALAVAYLTRHDALDLAPMLGLELQEDQR